MGCKMMTRENESKGMKEKERERDGYRSESESERDASQIHMFVSLQIREGAYEHEHLFMRDF